MGFRVRFMSPFFQCGWDRFLDGGVFLMLFRGVGAI